MPVARGPVLVFGATSGIAKAVALELAKLGHPLYLAARDPEELARVAADLHIRTGVQVWSEVFDAADEDSYSRYLQDVYSAAGKLEGVVFAVGYLGDQSKAEEDWTEAKKILETNFVQAAGILHLVGSLLELQESGWIVALSSVAGDRGRMSNYVYGSAKGGLTVFLQGLRSRMQKSGVHVMTVKPGPVDTSMTYGMDKLPLLADPAKVGATIVKALQKRKDVVYVPAPWKLIMFVLRSVPEKIFKKTSL